MFRLPFSVFSACLVLCAHLASADMREDASMAREVDPSPTRFDTLMDWFKDSTAVSYDQFKGFYSGRCFTSAEKDTPRNVMFGYLEQVLGDAGPGLPEKVIRKANAIFAEGMPADYYDNRPLANERLIFEAKTKADWKKISEVADGLNYMVDFEPNGHLDSKIEMVRHADYLVVKSTNLITQNRRNPWTGARFHVDANKEDVLCYLFKKMD